MSEFLEQPLLIAGLGAAAIVTFGYMWYQQGGKKLLGALIAAIVLTALLLLVERVVETPREEVKRHLTEMAAAVEQNDLPVLLSHISDTAPEIQKQAESEFPRHHFRELRITRFDGLKFDSEGERVTVQFVVVAQGDFYNGQFPSAKAPRAAELVLVKENGRWKVTNYKHWAPTPHQQP